MTTFTTEQCLKLLQNSSIDSGVKTILEAMLTNSIPTPIGSRLHIWKHVLNDNPTILEPNDIVSGFATETRFIKSAKFNGGDSTNWANYTILEQIDEIELTNI